MTQHLAGYLYVYAAGQQNGSCAVPKVVQPNMLEPRMLQYRVEVRSHQSPYIDRGTLQGSYGRFGKYQGTTYLGRLGSLESPFSSVAPNEGTANSQSVSFPVAPLETAGLARPDAGG